MPSAAAVGTGAVTGAAAGTAIFPGIGTAVGAVVGGLASFFGGLFADQTAQKEANLMRMQAQSTLARTEEQARRADIAREQQVGAGTAAAGASGFAKGGSMTLYLDQMNLELQRETDWMRKQGFQAAGMQLNAADITEEGGDASLVSGILGGVNSGISSVSRMGQQFNWWGGS